MEEKTINGLKFCVLEKDECICRGKHSQGEGLTCGTAGVSLHSHCPAPLLSNVKHVYGAARGSGKVCPQKKPETPDSLPEQTLLDAMLSTYSETWCPLSRTPFSSCYLLYWTTSEKGRLFKKEKENSVLKCPGRVFHLEQVASKIGLKPRGSEAPFLIVFQDKAAGFIVPLPRRGSSYLSG